MSIMNILKTSIDVKEIRQTSHISHNKRWRSIKRSESKYR